MQRALAALFIATMAQAGATAAQAENEIPATYAEALSDETMVPIVRALQKVVANYAVLSRTMTAVQESTEIADHQDLRFQASKTIRAHARAGEYLGRIRALLKNRDQTLHSWEHYLRGELDVYQLELQALQRQVQEAKQKEMFRRLTGAVRTFDDLTVAYLELDKRYREAISRLDPKPELRDVGREVEVPRDTFGDWKPPKLDVGAEYWQLEGIADGAVAESEAYQAP